MPTSESIGQTLLTKDNIDEERINAILAYLENPGVELKKRVVETQKFYNEVYPGDKPTDAAKEVETHLDKLLAQDIGSWKALQLEVKHYGDVSQLSRLLTCAEKYEVGHSRWVIG